MNESVKETRNDITINTTTIVQQTSFGTDAFRSPSIPMYEGRAHV